MLHHCARFFCILVPYTKYKQTDVLYKFARRGNVRVFSKNFSKIARSDKSDHDIIFSGPPSKCSKLEGSLGVLILNSLKANGNRIFQIDPETDSKQTHAEIRERSIRVALAFQQNGLKKGDVITLCTQNHVHTVLPFLAAIYLGVTVNIVHETFNKNELTRVLNLVQPKMIICDKKFKSMFEAVELKTKPVIKIGDGEIFEKEFLQSSQKENSFEAVHVDIHKANALILCSSGTTGLMKGIPHTHYTFYHAVCDTSFVISSEDNFLTFSPLVWNSSSWIILISAIYGVTRIAATWKGPVYAMELIEKYKATYLNLNPSKVISILTDNAFNDYPEMKNLRVVWSRGSPNTKEQMEFYRSKLPNTHVVNSIGCTEMAMLLSFFDPKTEFDLNKKKVYSVGRLCPGVKAKVIDQKTGKSLGRNETGELYLRAESLMNGYYNNPEANASAFDKNGWYRSGDLSYFDDDECLFIIGRLKEMLKYNTMTVSPTEVEQIINEHPDVVTSCVMGIPDKVAGDLPMAFVVKKKGSKMTEKDLIEFVGGQVSDHQRLRGGVHFLDEMPLTSTGKIRRIQLQEIIKKLTK